MKKACTVGTNFSDFTIVNKDSDVGIRTTGNFGLDLRNSSISMIPGSLHIGSNALDRNSSEPRLGGSHFNEQIVLGFYFGPVRMLWFSRNLDDLKKFWRNL